MSLLYISTDLNVNSSGGLVASKELEAMKMMGDEVIQLSYYDVHPTANNLPDIPYLIDYMTVDRLSCMDLSNVKLCHMYGGCYGQTIKYLKSKNIKTSFSCMFHERKVSIKEHEKYFGEYPFAHVKYDNLWRMYVVEALRNADVVITPGLAPRENILKEVPKANVRIIPHGTYIPAEISQIPEQFNVGYMGAIGPDKGLYYLIKAWEQLNYQDSTLIFTNMTSDFIQKSAKTGKFHIMGWVKALSDFHKNISVYIQPSSTEAFGMETIEAMAHGRPVIVSDGAGSADCIENGKEGFIVPRMNSQEIASKIDWFKNHPKELREMGENARQKSLGYSWNKIQEKYIKLWKSIC